MTFHADAIYMAIKGGIAPNLHAYFRSIYVHTIWIPDQKYNFLECLWCWYLCQNYCLGDQDNISDTKKLIMRHMFTTNQSEMPNDKFFRISC